MRKELETRVIKTELIDWASLQFIQQDDFKDLTEDRRSKLKASLVENHFVQPFYVWHDEESGIIYCLDGKHRTLILDELIAEGVAVPKHLPAIFIRCENKTEAAKLVLTYSSIYARVNQDGLIAFADTFNLSLPELESFIDLPGITTITEMPVPDELEADFKDKPAVMKITFDTPEQLQKAEIDIRELLDRKYEGAFFSVSCGEI